MRELVDGERPRRWGSDVMVDAIKALGIQYLALNPGASFRGLHDSLVNYGGNQPELIMCTHEKVAVGIAHGYAKVTGEAMGCVLHNTVGLLHGALGIFEAHLDRVPVMVFGGAGPMAYELRRPEIDWLHTANIQGNAVRDFTKWDDQPASIDSIHSSIRRAYRVAMTEPAGPVYVALDAELQEMELAEDVPPPDHERFPLPSPIGADQAALEELARMLMRSKRPLLVGGYAGRGEGTWSQMVALAELLGAGFIDTNVRSNFPSSHPLNVTGTDAIESADLVVLLDVRDPGRTFQVFDQTTREIRTLLDDRALVADVGFGDVGIAAWSHEFGSLHPVDLQVTADTTATIPLLLDLCEEMLGSDDQPLREDYRSELTAKHEQIRAEWRSTAEARWDEVPISLPRLAASTWNVVKEHDWVLTAGTARGWATRIWDFDEPYRHPGRSLGTATQFGISLGVALAYRGSGRLVVDLQPDGDLLYDVGAMFTAAYHQIPLLVVMVNNRAYENDLLHQERLAEQRSSPFENAYLGMQIDDPAPDFAGIARSFGWHGEGPIEDPEQLDEAIERAARVVITEQRPALVDVFCGRR